MKRFDEYEVVAELGRGGMGVVYEVRHPSFEGPLALKLCLREQATQDALARFQREAELLARVRHPNVVRVHALRDSPEGPYLVTEKIEGVELGDMLRHGPLPPERAAEIIRDLAGAVGALHREGIIHRDLKPTNVIVRRDGSPVLLDFGIARHADVERLTATGTLLGTPAYMAPEQAEGVSPDQLDERVDVYGLGATLFALLTARNPFEGETTVGIVRQVLDTPPPPPSAHCPGLPPGLDEVCARALAKNPAGRYGSAQALGEHLTELLAGDLSRAPAGSKGAGLFIGLGAVALALAALGGGLALTLPEGPPPKLEPAPPTAPPPATDAAPTGPSPEEQRAWEAEALRVLEDLVAGRNQPPGPARFALYRRASRALDRLQPRTKARRKLSRTLASWEGTLLWQPKPARQEGSTQARWVDADRLLVLSAKSMAGPGVVELLHLTQPEMERSIWLAHDYDAEGDPRGNALQALAVRRVDGRPESFLFAGDTLELYWVGLEDGSPRAPADALARKRPPREVPPCWTVPDDAPHISDRGYRDLFALAVSPDGRHAALGGDFKHVFLLELGDGGAVRELARLPCEPPEGGEYAFLTQLTFSADGQTLFGAAGANQLYREPPNIPSHLFAWAVPSGALLAQASPGWARFRVNALAPSPAAPILAAGLQNESTHLVRLEGERLTVHPIASNKDGAQGLWTHAQNQASGAAFSPDGRLLYLITTEVESASEEQPDKYRPTHTSWLRLFTVDPSAASAARARERIPIADLAHGLDLSPDGRLLVLSLASGRFQLWAPPRPR